VMTQVATPGGLKLRIRDRVLREAVAPVRRDDERLADILEAVIDVPQLASQVLAIQSGRTAA
jgi:hypothetical protein